MIDDKKKLFRRLIARDELHHAYLFFGQQGTGKSAFARSLASLLENRGTDSKNQPLIDTLIIRGSAKNADSAEKMSTGVEEIREIKNFLNKKPLLSPKRLVIIDPAENLTWQAEAALLKIAEETPPHGLIIFIVENPNNLPPTLLSRLTKIYFRNASRSLIEQILIKNCKITLERAEEISKKSLGSIARALSIANQKNQDKPAMNDNLENATEEAIINLYLESSIKNSKKIACLLTKEETIKRFNLNKKIQKKAIDLILQS